ncbi:MAG: ROK family protein [Bacillota bacterium]|nr:ROK family protein [Bacillota bacterium]
MKQTDLSSGSRHCILAVDAGGSVLKAALVNPQGSLIPDSVYRLPVDSAGSRDDVAGAYVTLAAQGKAIAAQLDLILDGIGVSIPGPFNYEQGFCLMTHKYQAIYKVPMRPWFEAGAGPIPVRFVHDSTAFMLGATWQGRFNVYRRICAVIIGTGLGFASMFDGRVFRNDQGGPGISIYARPFRDGTAEDYVSRRGIINRYRKLKPEAFNTRIGQIAPDVKDIADLARSGDKAAVRVFRDTGIFLAEILHDIIKENGFEVLLLGGQIAKSAGLFLPELMAGLDDLPVPPLVWPAEAIDEAPLLGVARACWQIN